MKIVEIVSGVMTVMVGLSSIDSMAAFQRIPFPAVSQQPDNQYTLMADAKAPQLPPGKAILSQTDDEAKPAPGFTVRLIRSNSKSSFKTVFKVEPLDYTIQVSSFRTKEEAKTKIAELARAPLTDLWVMSAKVNGQIWYRVCAGHFKTKLSAAAAQTKVAATSGIKQAFVQKVVPRLTASNSDAS